MDLPSPELLDRGGRRSLVVGGLADARSSPAKRQELAVIGAFGGAERDRTVDLRLAKPALSQLSYSPLPTRAVHVRTPWARADLNCRPHAYQACALTT